MTLGHLDTIIAFVVILAGVSLLVIVFTQTFLQLRRPFGELVGFAALGLERR
jgi:hypothetical protein